MKNALLINYQYCTGCHTCEIACQKQLGLEPGQFGIKLVQIGPDHISDRTWQYEFFPHPTDRCDRCASRTEMGKQPLCVQSCQAGCMEYGQVEELAKKIDSDKYVLFA